MQHVPQLTPHDKFWFLDMGCDIEGVTPLLPVRVSELKSEPANKLTDLLLSQSQAMCRSCPTSEAAASVPKTTEACTKPIRTRYGQDGSSSSSSSLQKRSRKYPLASTHIVLYYIRRLFCNTKHCCFSLQTRPPRSLPRVARVLRSSPRGAVSRACQGLP